MIAQSFTNYKHPYPYLPYPWCELPEHGKPFSDHDFTACLATALAPILDRAPDPTGATT